MASADYRAITVNVPCDLADRIEKLAKTENRTASELLSEAFRRYWAQQVQRVLDESNERFGRNNPEGYTEADVERLIDEYRAEQSVLKPE